jgi:hypothetical protein
VNSAFALMTSIQLSGRMFGLKRVDVTGEEGKDIMKSITISIIQLILLG